MHKIKANQGIWHPVGWVGKAEKKPGLNESLKLACISAFVYLGREIIHFFRAWVSEHSKETVWKVLCPYNVIEWFMPGNKCIDEYEIGVNRVVNLL